MLFLDRYAPAVPYTVAMSLGPGCFPKVGKKRFIFEKGKRVGVA